MSDDAEPTPEPVSERTGVVIGILITVLVVLLVFFYWHATGVRNADRRSDPVNSAVRRP